MRSVLLASMLLFSASVTAQDAPEPLTSLYSKPSPWEKISSERYIAESENAFVTLDRYPQAPIHLLIVPKKRVPTILQASPGLIAEMLELAKRVAVQEGVDSNGFRLVINTHPMGGQSVYHFHIHLLAGRQMRWPPG